MSNSERAELAPLLNCSEVAALLGVRPKTVRRMVRARRLPPPITVGRRVLMWDLSQIVRFLARRRQQNGVPRPERSAAAPQSSVEAPKLLSDYLRYIHNYIQEHGVSPSYRELAYAWKAPRGSVSYIISKLQHLGLLTRTPYMPRSLTVTERGRRYLESQGLDSEEQHSSQIVLTDNEAEVLQAFVNYHKAHAEWPTCKQLAETLGKKPLSTAGIVAHLVEKGLVSKMPGMSWCFVTARGLDALRSRTRIPQSQTEVVENNAGTDGASRAAVSESHPAETQAAEQVVVEDNPLASAASSETLTRDRGEDNPVQQRELSFREILQHVSAYIEAWLAQHDHALPHYRWNIGKESEVCAVHYAAVKHDLVTRGNFAQVDSEHEFFRPLVRTAIELVMDRKGYEAITENEAEIILGWTMAPEDKDDPDYQWFRIRKPRPRSQ